MLLSRRSKTNQAFTLVEMAVVLVIIGLLAGGIVVGQSLIRRAGLNGVMSDFQTYKGASEQFQVQYRGLAGDLVDATEYWGTAAAGTACGTTVGTGTATCNGDGDGMVRSSATTSSSESYRFWQQLANAGLIQGNYSGIPTNGGAFSDFYSDKSNSPAGRLNSSLWFIWATAGSTGTNSFDAIIVGNWLSLGAYNTISWPKGAILTNEEIWSIDKKIDDGMPGVGTVLAFPWSCTNATSSADSAATYNLANKTTACAVQFVNVIK